MSPAEPDEDARWSPDPDSTETWPVKLLLDGLDRIMGRQGLDKETGRLAEFSLTSQVEDGGRWCDVARVDTCHEEVHFHLFSGNGDEILRESLLPIRSINDVDRGYPMGEKVLLAGWEEHVKRWNRGR